jgi:hypothetical protein
MLELNQVHAGSYLTAYFSGGHGRNVKGVLLVRERNYLAQKQV